MKSLIGTLAVAALACLASLGGCGTKEPERPAGAPAPVAAPAPAPVSALPGQAPAAGQVPAERTVADDEVRRHWKAVEFELREKKQGGSSRKVQVAIGEQVKLAGTPLTLKLLGFVPDFAMGADSVTTKSMQDVNPAVKIQVLDGEKELFKGWAFRDFPDMHSFEDPRYAIKMVRAVPGGNEASTRP